MKNPFNSLYDDSLDFDKGVEAKLKRALSAVFAFCIVILSVYPLPSPTFAASFCPSWRQKQSDGSIFFPYSWCLAFDVLDIAPHQNKGSYDKAVVDVQVQIKYVLRDGTQISEFAECDRFDNRKANTVKVGDKLILCLSHQNESDMYRLLKLCRGKTQVWAFSGYSSSNGSRLYLDFDNHFEPFKPFEFSDSDLRQLKEELDTVVLDPALAVLPVQDYLKQRWTKKRILEYCRDDSRLIMCVPVPRSDFSCCGKRSQDFYLRGELYVDAPTVGHVIWSADTINKVPTGFGVVVRRGKNIWQLDRDDFDLGAKFTDDDVLRKRIHDTLQYALMRSFLTQLRAPTPEERRKGGSCVYSSTKLSGIPAWQTFTINRSGARGKLKSVDCKIAGVVLSVVLDASRNIEDVTVNGERANEWLDALADANKERLKEYGH